MSVGHGFAQLKAWQLKHLAFLLGTASTGTKAELQSVLARTLDIGITTTSRKIVSVDMGIRNLAYCVIDMKPSHGRTQAQTLTVSAWSRRDLLKPEAPEASPLQASEAGDEQAKSGRIKPKLDTAAFTPPQLSRTAYNLVRDLLSHKPDDILIERQRFRSGGAAAIQEWTVRVNMLESMLWASLETLRASGQSASFPQTHAIAPKRVAEFWLSDQGLGRKPSQTILDATAQEPAKVPKTRAKIEKKEKVDLVKKWASGVVDELDVHLAFDDQAAEIARAFRQQTKRGANKLAGGKLDDLADCLLQAVAFVKWDENKGLIRRLLQNQDQPP